MTDYKYAYAAKVALGKNLAGTAGTDYETVEALVRVSDRLVSPGGAMVEPLVVINQVNPAGVGHRGRYWEIEVEVDSDNPAFYLQDVDNTTGGTQAALEDDAVNTDIDGFAYYVEESDGTDVKYLFEAARVYLTRASGRVSNERGNDRNTAVYRFICRGNRTRTEEAAITSPGQVDDVQYTGVNGITISGASSTNILWYEWSFEAADGGDVLTPRFTPNTYESVGVTEWPGKVWRIRLAIDSETSVFDSFINDDGVGAVIPSTVITLDKAGGGTATHTYAATKVYVANYDPYLSMSEGSENNYGVIELLCYGTRSVG